MTARRTRSAFAWATLVALAVTASACSSDDDGGGDEPDTAATTEDDGDDQSGDDQSGDESADDTPGDDDTPDEAAEALAAETARADAAEEALAAAEAEVATQTEAAAAATAQVNELTTALTGETTRADTAEQELDDISALFPITIDSALDGFDIAGTYNLTWAEAYCDTFARCGTLPATTRVTIAPTPEGWLELQVPNLFTVALFAVQGSLYGVTDTTQILPPCGDAPQVSRVTVTIYADGVTIQSDGSRTVDKLGSAVTVSGSFAEGCIGGTIFYGAELVRA